MKSIFAFAVSLALFFPVWPANAQNNINDLEAMKQIERGWHEAWNRHDMKALAALVAEDVDFITIAGTLLKGRNAFEGHHTSVHAMQFKESLWTTTDVQVKFLKPDIALVHVNWGIRGDKDPDGTPRQPRQGIFTWVVEKRKGRWLIIAAQNTNIREPAVNQSSRSVPQMRSDGSDPATSCQTPAVRHLRTILYFGLARPAGTVSEAEWQAFVRDEVTPRFPEGLTVWEVSGQYRQANGMIIRERSKVLLLVHADTPAAHEKVESLVARYKQMFEQESVLWETATICVIF